MVSELVNEQHFKDKLTGRVHKHPPIKKETTSGQTENITLLSLNGMTQACEDYIMRNHIKWGE